MTVFYIIIFHTTQSPKTIHKPSDNTPNRSDILVLTTFDPCIGDPSTDAIIEVCG